MIIFLLLSKALFQTNSVFFLAKSKTKVSLSVLCGKIQILLDVENYTFLPLGHFYIGKYSEHDVMISEIKNFRKN